jgi:hypothetical protein
VVHDWTPTRNLAGLPDGQVRSVLGYAGESLVIGRALICGYNLFFKAWRDSKYDAVLDHDGVLYRVEIKQSGNGKALSVTSGGRSGAQINRDVESREEIVSTQDCEILIGVHSMTGECWIVPTEVLEILGRKTLNTLALEPFRESWNIFQVAPAGFGLNQIKTRLRKMSLLQIEGIAHELGINGPLPSYELGIRTSVDFSERPIDGFAMAIWIELGNLGKIQRPIEEFG